MRNSRTKAKRRQKNRKSIIVILLLFIALYSGFKLKNKLPFLFDRVTAGGMEEEIPNHELDTNIGEAEKEMEDNIENNKDDNEGSKEDVNSAKDKNDEYKKEEPQKDTQGNEHENKNDTEEWKNLKGNLIVANKKFHLEKDYKPEDLVIPNIEFSFSGEHEKKNMRKEAAQALEGLFTRGKEEGMVLYAVSGYRSYATQERVFRNKVNSVGEEEANKLVARPGESEHQTGLAMDVTSHSAKLSLSTSFGKTEEGKWLKENAHKFGFIIRYLEDKTHITGYSYEPWHVRYVGKDVAQKLYDEGIVLEEYFGID